MMGITLLQKIQKFIRQQPVILGAVLLTVHNIWGETLGEDLSNALIEQAVIILTARYAWKRVIPMSKLTVISNGSGRKTHTS